MRKLTSYVCMRCETMTPADPGVVDEIMGKVRQSHLLSKAFSSLGLACDFFVPLRSLSLSTATTRADHKK